MTETLKGKVALVTGGSSGIGRATALVFAQRGARVVVADVNVEGGEETVSLIHNGDGEAVFIHTDVTQASEIEHLIGKTVETYGQLDCAFNNAGIAGDLSLTADCSEEHWNRVMSINLRGVWLCMKHELSQMLKQGGGAIVNTASVLGLVGIIGQTAYIAQTVVWLCSDAASFVTGHSMAADGGYTAQ